MPPLLFFGAGASQPFGIPVMTEMVDEFEKHVKENYSSQFYLYSSIKEKLKSGYDVAQVDIESIFSVIEGIANGVTPKEFGHLPYYYINRFSSETKFSDAEIKDAQILKEELQKYIKSRCRANIDDDEKEYVYRNSYEVFFSNLCGVSKTKNTRGYEYPINWKAYTTNYDSIFEEFVAELTPMSDFFEKNNSDILYFNPAKQLDWQSFVKLHGSLDWTRLEDGSIIKSPNDSYTRTKKKGTAMLYPIQQKDLYLNPWITLFQELKRGLTVCDLWYVIGYAFNDPFILEIFKEAFSDKKQMILINPNAKGIKRKFPEKNQQHIASLPLKFGNEYFAKDIEDHHNSKRTLEINLETEAKRVEIGFSLPIDPNRVTISDKSKFVDGVDRTHYGQSLTRLGFHSPNQENGHILLTVSVVLDDKFPGDLEFTIFTSEEKPVNLKITNQDRFIDSLATSSWQYQDHEKMYQHKISLERKKFDMTMEGYSL